MEIREKREREKSIEELIPNIYESWFATNELVVDSASTAWLLLLSKWIENSVICCVFGNTSTRWQDVCDEPGINNSNEVKWSCFHSSSKSVAFLIFQGFLFSSSYIASYIICSIKYVENDLETLDHYRGIKNTVFSLDNDRAYICPLEVLKCTFNIIFHECAFEFIFFVCLHFQIDNSKFESEPVFNSISSI